MRKLLPLCSQMLSLDLRLVITDKMRHYKQQDAALTKEAGIQMTGVQPAAQHCRSWSSWLQQLWLA
jgi:hypothetical protein